MSIPSGDRGKVSPRGLQTSRHTTYVNFSWNAQQQWLTHSFLPRSQSPERSAIVKHGISKPHRDTTARSGGGGWGTTNPSKPELAAYRQDNRAHSAPTPSEGSNSVIRLSQQLSPPRRSLPVAANRAGVAPPSDRHSGGAGTTSSALSTASAILLVLLLLQLPEPGQRRVRPRGADTALTLLCQAGPGPASGAAAATPTASIGHAGAGGRSGVSPRGSNAPTAEPSGSSAAGRRPIGRGWPAFPVMSPGGTGGVRSCRRSPARPPLPGGWGTAPGCEREKLNSWKGEIE